MTYLEPIKTALLYFPFIAFLFTLPYIIKQYRKYGSIHGLRTIIIYSFILYIMCTYFLVILPLPKMNEVTAPLKDAVQLVPFHFIADFLKETCFDISVPKTYLKALIEPCFYTVFLNILMTVPFGIYLRYYFKCDLKTTVKISFLLSLFFELTQLTGLYFIYPYSYRVFDVDDLIVNTLGGFLGFYLGGALMRFLPSRDAIDRKSFEKGRVVSGPRRFVAASIDLFVFFNLALLSTSLIKIDYIFFTTFVIYFTVIPFYTGSTIGGKVLKIDQQYINCYFLRSLGRTVFLYFYYFFLPYEFCIKVKYIIGLLGLQPEISIWPYLALFIILFTFYLFNVIYIFKNRRSFYDRLFGMEYKSMIQNDD